MNTTERIDRILKDLQFSLKEEDKPIIKIQLEALVLQAKIEQLEIKK